MSRLTRDPELDQLVRSINERPPEATGPVGEPVPPEPVSEAWPPAEVPSGDPMEALLVEMARRGASDMLIMAGAPPIFRVGGKLQSAETAPFANDEMEALFASLLATRV